MGKNESWRGPRPVDNSVDCGVQDIHILRGRSGHLAPRLLAVLQVTRFQAFVRTLANFTKIAAMTPQVSQIKAFHRSGIAAFRPSG
jgi:hypothetical protein